MFASQQLLPVYLLKTVTTLHIFSPHLVVFGDRHVRGDDRTIRSIGFTIDDAFSIFHDYDAFGSVFGPKAMPLMRQIEADELREGRAIALGEHPEIFYHTGRFEVLSTNTPVGIFSVAHRPTITMPGVHGIKVKNRIHLDLEFESPVTVEHALDQVFDLKRFLEIIAGRPQNLYDLQVNLARSKEKPQTLDLYWSMHEAIKRQTKEREPHPMDVLIRGATNSKEFSSALCNWLGRNAEWRDARVRFSSSFNSQNRYGIERIVGAANMFDILPSSAIAKKVPLPKEVLEAKETARELFKALPDSLERNSILGALGRIGIPSLKHKVQHRASMILADHADRFPDFELVLGQAVDCRNHYVHGSSTKINYSENFEFVSFLTNTLEFVFATSDLIESGWNMERWLQNPSAGTHPFGEYVRNYKLRCQDLKQTLDSSVTP